jgi:hypothetical protein
MLQLEKPPAQSQTLYVMGRCTNDLYCSLAAADQNVLIRMGDKFVCPQCGKALTTEKPTRPASPRRAIFITLCVIGFLAINACAFFIGRLLVSTRPASTSAITIITPPSVPPGASVASSAPPQAKSVAAPPPHPAAAPVATPEPAPPPQPKAQATPAPPAPAAASHATSDQTAAPTPHLNTAKPRRVVTQKPKAPPAAPASPPLIDAPFSAQTVAGGMPPYPERYADEGRTGEVTVNCTIEKTGAPTGCVLISQAGGAEFATTVMTWLASGAVRFAPIVKKGRVVFGKRQWTITFEP